MAATVPVSACLRRPSASRCSEMSATIASEPAKLPSSSKIGDAETLTHSSEPSARRKRRWILGGLPGAAARLLVAPEPGVLGHVEVADALADQFAGAVARACSTMRSLQKAIVEVRVDDQDALGGRLDDAPVAGLAGAQGRFGRQARAVVRGRLERAPARRTAGARGGPWRRSRRRPA